MSLFCKQSNSVSSTCKTANSVGSVGKVASDVGSTEVSSTPIYAGEFSFFQYSGPFEYPAFAFEVDGDFYLTQTVSGLNKTKYSPIATNPAEKDCSLGGVNGASGVASTVFSGSVSYSLAGVLTGQLQAQINRAGGFGAYDFPGSPGTSVDVTANTWENLLLNIVLSNGSSVWSGQVTSKGETEAVIEFYTERTEGFFAGQFGGPYAHIWCPGFSVFRTFSNKITESDLGKSITSVGEPARTQELETYDSNTRTYTGNRSYVTFGVDVNPSKLVATVDFTFRVSPPVGDVYNLVVSRNYPITGSYLEVTAEFPRVLGSSVYFIKAEVSYRISVFETFESYLEGEYESFEGTVNWEQGAKVNAPAPNGGCYDTFEEYNEGAISSLPGGRGWAGDLVLNSTDYSSAYDTFESYSEGTIFVYTDGIGWSGGSGSAVVDYSSAYDSFENYAEGTISTLTEGSGWSDDGICEEVSYRSGWDTFETYAEASIFIFDFESASTYWLDSGVAVTRDN